MSHRPIVRFVLVLAALLAVGVAGCSSGANSASTKVTLNGPCGTNKPTTITIGLFGTFGFKENGLYKEYEQLCHNIKIHENVVTASADYWTRLKTRLASGSGLDDVVAIEQGFVADVVQNHADQFVNLQKTPQAAALKKDYYPWKWKQATTPDGKTTIGLGTDIGPEAICYRTDLLNKAGMAGTPEELAQKWATWDKFIQFGKQYKAKTGHPFLDAAQSVFSTAVYQGKRAYSNEQGQPDLEHSDGVKTAWKYATRAAQAGITAKLAQFSDAWSQSFATGSRFAAIACPTWMMPYIQSQAGPGSAGKWSVAPVLPGGASNWGGSFLAVPAAADQKAAAVAFVTWLSEKNQQVKMWTAKAQGGHFPSNEMAVKDPAVSNATSSYFSNAPVGKIYGDIAGKMKSPPIGVYDTQIATVLSTQLSNVEKRGTPPDKAWAKAMDQIQQITG